MSIIEYGEKFFDEVEIHKVQKKEVSSSVELNQISSSSSAIIERTVIRGIKDGKVGIYITDSTDNAKIKEGFKSAYHLSRVNTSDEKWPGLPGPYGQNYEKIHMNAERNMDPDYFVNMLTEVLKTVKSMNSEAMVVGGESGATWTSSEIMNSHGISVKQEDFIAYFILVMVSRQGNKVTPSIFDMDIKKTKNLNTERVIKSCLEKLSMAKTVKKVDARDATVVLEPFALAEILQFSLFPSFNGERKVKNTSILADKVGERIMSEQITIEDNPFHKDAINRVIADDEGVATKRNILVDHGEMRGFLWNNYWGKMAGETVTGNGIRSFRTGAMGTGAHNMVIREGHKNKDDMIAEMKKGYIVSSFQGAHSSNPDTGKIATVANPAFVVEDGQITGSTVFMISGNIYDIMNNIRTVGSNLKPVYMMGKGLFPDIMFDHVKIAPVSR